MESNETTDAALDRAGEVQISLSLQETIAMKQQETMLDLDLDTVL